MKIMQWGAFVFICLVVVAGGLIPEFHISKQIVVLCSLLAIPLLSPFLEEAKIFGNKFKFKKDIEKIDHLIKIEEAKPSKLKAGKQKKLFLTKDKLEMFSTSVAKQVLDIDPNLALAAMRIEIESVLKLATSQLIGPIKTASIKEMVQLLNGDGFISKEITSAIIRISDACNNAVHGGILNREEAKIMIELLDRVNKFMPLGYSINFTPNKDYKKLGLICEWEHCIEHYPLHEKDTKVSCPIFGHDCPGGLKTVKNCKTDSEKIAHLTKALKKRFS